MSNSVHSSQVPSDSDTGSEVDLVASDVEDDEAPAVEVAIDAQEAPGILKVIQEGASEDVDEEISKITRIITQHPSAVASIDATIVTLLSSVSAATPDLVRNGIVNLYCTILAVYFTVLEDVGPSRELLIKQLDKVILLLRNGDVSDRQVILIGLEAVVTDPEVQTVITAGFLTHLFHEDLELTAEQSVSVLETFENTMIYSRGAVITSAIHAGAVELVVREAFNDDIAVSSPAVECLKQLVTMADELDAELSNSPGIGKWEAVPPVLVLATTIFLRLLKSNVVSMARTAAEFFQVNEDENTSMLLADDLAAISSLVQLLGKKETPGTIGCAQEWVLIKLHERDEGSLVVAAMKALWADSKVTVDEKLTIAVEFCETFQDIRLAALKSGLAVVLVELGEAGNVRALHVLAKILETEQLAGETLLNTETVHRLVDLLAGETSEIRCHTAAALGHLCDSYTSGDEREPLRPVIVAVLLAEDSLPKILAAVSHDDLKTAGSACNLLGDSVIGELGTESWEYDTSSETPPPPCPNKEKLITPTFIDIVLNLVNHLDSSIGAVHLLAQLAWGFPPGFDAIREGMKKCSPVGSVHFFANMYGKSETNYAGRQRRLLAEASAQVGAFARVTELLEQTTAQDPKADRRAAVEGYWFLLASESINNDDVRQNKRVPLALAELVADEDLESLKPIENILSTVGCESWMSEWTPFGTLETAKHLANIIRAYPHGYSIPCPDSETMESDAYEADYKEWDEVQEQTKKICESTLKTVLDIVKQTLPAFGVRASPLLSPLITRTTEVTWLDEILPTIDTIVKFPGVDSAALVATLSVQFSPNPSFPLDTRDMLIIFKQWVEASPSLCLVIEQAGGVDFLFKSLHLVASEKSAEDEDDYEPEIDLHEQACALMALGAFVKSIPEGSAAISQRFFEDPVAFPRAIEALEAEEFWAHTVTGLNDLTIEYPLGAATLSKAGAEPLLLCNFDKEYYFGGAAIASLLGLMAPDDGNGAFAEHLTAHFVRLRESAGGKGKGKKKKKSQSEASGLDMSSMWDRVIAAAKSCRGGRAAAVNAGAVQEAVTELRHKGTSLLGHALEFILSLLRANEGYDYTLVEFLPDLKAPLRSGKCTDVLLNVVHMFVPNHTLGLISSGIIATLVNILLSDTAPASDARDILVAILAAAAETPEGKQLIVKTLREFLAAPAADEWDIAYGCVSGLHSLVYGDSGLGRAVVEAGSVDYALRLLQSTSEPQTVLKGVGLTAALSLAPNTRAHEVFVSLGAILVVEAAMAHAKGLSEKPYVAAPKEEPVAATVETDEEFGMVEDEGEVTEESPEDLAEAARQAEADAKAERDVYVDVTERLGQVLDVLKGMRDVYEES